LFARGGKWKTEQLISKKWIADATTPSPANKSYGYLWWLNAEGRAKDASKKVYWAEGFGGNIIVIDEQNDLVVVARWLDPAKIPDFIDIVERAVR
jgi:CubicO group peptidase (beta-lactamase class C family)